MLQEDRHKIIYDRLKQSDSVKVTELVGVLQVSIDTVRRDLEALEKKGLIRRVHGGAVLDTDLGEKRGFSFREIKNRAEKQELAVLACEYVTEGQAVALNAGTTNIEVAKQLVSTFDRLTIITNSLHVIDACAGSGFTIIVLGGVFDHEERSLYGQRCEEEIASYNIDVAFLAVNAISLDKGITDFRLNEFGIIRNMIKSSRQRIVVADASKFDKYSYMNVCPLSDIDAIVTDSSIDPAIALKYQKAQVRVQWQS